MNYKPFKTVVRIWDGNMNGGLCRYLQALGGMGYKTTAGCMVHNEGEVLFHYGIYDGCNQLEFHGDSVFLGTRIIFLHGKDGTLQGVLKMTQEEAEDFLVEEEPVDKNTFWCEVAKSANKQQQELEDALRAICLDISKAINKKD